jgi:hypothetical protein
MSVLGVDQVEKRSNVSGSWGTATDGQSWSHPVGGSTINVTSGHLVVVNTPGTWDHMILGSKTSGPQEVYTEFHTSATTENFGALLRYTSAGTSGYMMVFDGGSGGVYIYLEDPINGLTTLASKTMTVSSGATYGVRARADGSNLLLKIWNKTSSEPTSWTVTTTDSTYTSGEFGLLAKASSSPYFLTFQAVDYPVSDSNTVTEVVTTSTVSSASITETSAVTEVRTTQINVTITESYIVTEVVTGQSQSTIGTSSATVTDQNNAVEMMAVQMGGITTEARVVGEVVTGQSQSTSIVTVSVTITETNPVTEQANLYSLKPQFVPGVKSGLQILYAGIDISEHVQDSSIQIKSILGQGPGMSGSGSSHSATAQLEVDFGAVGDAIGAGTLPRQAAVVRMGEIQIWDPSGIPLFGGFVSKIEDLTEKTKQYTQLDCYDYWQHLDRIYVQKNYSGASDTFIIRDLIQTFAPWLDVSALPTTTNYQFSVKVYKGITLQKALAQITDITGFALWIDPLKVVHYESPALATQAPFSLSSNPNFRTSFNCGVETFTIDDTAAINRCTFYGGKIPSSDFTQDLSTQANGNNKVFVLAYYPREASDGKIHVYVNGIEQVIGYANGTDSSSANVLKSQGGLADVLVNADAHTLTFDVAPTNSGPNSVTCKYRYEFPMTIQITDPTSFRFFGSWYDGIISDDTVFDYNTAVARCRTMLAEQSFGLTQLTVHCWKPGIQPGQIIRVDHDPRNIHMELLVQEVDVAPLGKGVYQYVLTLGNWTYNLIDALVRTADAAEHAQLAATTDVTNVDATTQDTNLIWVEQMIDTYNLHESYSVHNKPYTYVYARSSPIGDGHDGFPGFSVIQS